MAAKAKKSPAHDDDTTRTEPLRASAFYNRMSEEAERRQWNIRTFGEFLGVGDLLYKWRTRVNRAQKHGAALTLPEAETLLLVAVRLTWSLDRLLEGVSPAYDRLQKERVTRPVTEPAETVPTLEEPPPMPATLSPARQRLAYLIHTLTDEEVDPAFNAVLSTMNERRGLRASGRKTQRE